MTRRYGHRIKGSYWKAMARSEGYTRSGAHGESSEPDAPDSKNTFDSNSPLPQLYDIFTTAIFRFPAVSCPTLSPPPVKYP
jgi:hypothetical protein